MEASEKTHEIRDIVKLMKEEGHEITKEDIAKVAAIVFTSPYSLFANGFGGRPAEASKDE